MIYTTLISVPQLISEIGDPDLAIIDCRFSLEDPELGRQNYLEAHIPGAIYAHLDQDLCSPVIEGVTGRHPLPSVENFADKLGDWGINSSSQVVVYDDAGGAMAASRLWWLLRWLGHYAVSVLDGGWQAWLKSGEAVRGGQETRYSSMFIPRVRHARLIEKEEILARLHDANFLLIDSRDEDRYRGEVEPIDPVAGHIPGALPSPHLNILDAEGKCLPPEALRHYFQPLLGEISPRDTVFYCGSGVTSTQNVLAMEHAGMGDARLYAGSWSEWITDPERPIAIGEST
ncbi:MAG: sulfurtransferase [Chloroflexi bacterium]|nr:sulfurtransferase [Chloroflexota bacterium]